MNNIKEIEEFLDNFANKINKILIEDNNKAKYTGFLFNIFEITNISEKEVYMCKFLAELLNPRGKHYQGTKYLDLFYERFLQKQAPDLETKNVKIDTETFTNYINNDKRRMDILIFEEGKYYIPIEVKINADEQPEQCNEYLNQAQEYYTKHGIKKDSLLCFLTKYGKTPETTDKPEQIICISWNNIIEWLNTCIYQDDTLIINPLMISLLQYREAIKTFMEGNNKMSDDVVDLLAKNLNTVKIIADNFDKAKEKIWEILGEKIEEEIEKNLGKNDAKFIKTSWLIAYKIDEQENNNIAMYNVISRENNGDIKKLQALYCRDGNNLKYIPGQKRKNECFFKDFQNIVALSSVYSQGKNFDTIVNECVKYLCNKF